MIKRYSIARTVKFVVILIMAFHTCSSNAQIADHVILVTIDGFRPDFYLDSSWHADHIRELMQRGTHANGVNSVFPSMTYPAHTTIVTGVQPAGHGIYYNVMFDHRTGSNGKIYWNDSSIKVPTLWEAAQKKGLKVAALLWPVSANAAVNFNIPDIADLGDDVQENYSRPVGFTAQLREHIFGGADKIDYGLDTNVARIAAYLVRTEKPGLMTIHLFGVDHYQHKQGREGDSVRAAVAAADAAVGIIMRSIEAAGIENKTVLIVTGDHGFMNVKHAVSPNVWLAAAGLCNNPEKNDWKARFYSVGGSSYLYLKNREDRETFKQVELVLRNLPGDQRQYFRIINRAQLDSIGANPEVELALSAEKEASFNNAFTGDAVKESIGGAHGHFPDFKEIRTGFVIAGPGITKQGVIPVMNLRDIAPVVSKLLNLSMPAAQGSIPAGLFSK